MAYGDFNWGGVSVNLDDIPEAVRAGLMKRTLIHKLSNEVAAAVGKVREKDGKTGEEFDDDYEPVTLDLREKMVAKVLDGTIGLRIGGPRGNTLENIAYDLAMKQAEASLAPKGYWPKPDKKAGIKAEDATVDFAGRPMTRDDLAEMVLEKYKDRLMEEAKVEHAKRIEKAKANKANAVKPVANVNESIDNLI
jgi:hypothetical protein